MKFSLLTLCIVLFSFANLSAQEPPAADAPAGETVEAVEVVETQGEGGPEVVTTAEAWSAKLAAGGWTVVVQILLSMIGGAYLIGSLMQFRRSNIAPDGLVEEADRLWRAGKIDELEKLPKTRPSTLSRIIGFLVTERDSTVEDLTTTAGDMAAREINRHVQRAYPLAIVATLEPLLGLLGTVIGMIESFDTVAAAGSLGDASLLAGGISKALVTTAVGLIIAIPFLGFYHHFRSKASQYTTLLEEDLTYLIRHWFIKKQPATTPASQEAAAK